MNPQKPDFALPSFSRRMWVSDQARERWETKFIQCAECWRQIEWITVVEKVRPCALVLISQQELAGLALTLQAFGLRAISLSARVGNEGNRKILLHRVAIGQAKDLRAFRKAWSAGNDEVIGELLGYPSCCRAFFHEVFVHRELTDCTWSMGLNTVGSAAETQRLEVVSPPELNVFWVSAGLRMVPHFPCRFDCPEAFALAQKFTAAGKRIGHSAAIDDALEILRWPVEWSGLHGIAEIRTPVWKISQRTDVTMQKCTLLRLGDSYPKEGAKGLLSVLKLNSLAI